jgi:galactose mutarotase-like enzyme
MAVSRPFPSWNRSMLTEICLCHACSCPEILRTETGGQVRTNAPALQVHTANNIDANPKVWSGKQGALYQKHGAINLETQNYPNAINTAHFPSPILRPRERYHHVAVHSFELGLLQH